MKKLLLSLLVLLPTLSFGSHVLTGEIQISHISGFNYEMKVIMYTDPTAIPPPSNLNVDSYQRDGASYIETFNLAFDTTFLEPSSTVGCPTNLYTLNRHEFVSQVTLSPTVYNHQGGYLFHLSTCCRPAGLSNILNSSANGLSYVLMFPPVVNGSGNQIINSSPVLNNPVNDLVINNHPYYNFFGGFDTDGDSLSFILSDPFNQSNPSPGIVNTISSPYPDPSTQFAKINWASTYGTDNQIHGMGANPSPDRFQIDAHTGLATLIADESAPSYKLVGIWCQEFRNGVLIGSSFRDFTLLILEDSSISNQDPSISAQSQSLSSWNGDTLEFTGSPVCVQLEITDSDSVADISLFVNYSAYDESDYSLLQGNSIIRNQDTFITALCFQPDSFLNYPTRVGITAMDEKCYESSFDSLEFYIRFNGYSNAGTGGNISIPIIPSLGNLDLITYLNGNPNPGGTWLDLDNSGLLTGGILDASGINSDISYRFDYVDQQPNYTADTAELEMNFFIVQSLNSSEDLAEVNIYPNPSNGVITLEVSGALVGKTASVYTLESQEVKRFNLDSNTNTISIMKSGMYLIKIDGKTQVHKVFIEN